MKSLVEKIREKMPTLVVFQHTGNQDAADVLIKELEDKYGERVSIVRVDASHNGQYKEEYKLTEYPTYIIYKEGQELMRESGKKTIADLEDMIARAGVAS
ncbi:MAG: thioredoxin family protein [Paramuribaculum sp.]|nr:thioredoxin family protein [Paramuribaculum sp.]